MKAVKGFGDCRVTFATENALSQIGTINHIILLTNTIRSYESKIVGNTTRSVTVPV